MGVAILFGYVIIHPQNRNISYRAIKAGKNKDWDSGTVEGQRCFQMAKGAQRKQLITRHLGTLRNPSTQEAKDEEPHTQGPPGL